MSDFAAKSLRELRVRAGLTQMELAKRSGVSSVTIGYIEQGRVKPRELTWRKLLKGLSDVPAPGPDEQALERIRGVAQESRDDIFIGALDREEFLRRLKQKMSESLGALFNQVLIVKIIEAADFFSRQRYYPGDFATAVELLGALLKTRRDPDPSQKGKGAGRRKWRRR